MSENEKRLADAKQFALQKMQENAASIRHLGRTARAIVRGEPLREGAAPSSADPTLTGKLRALVPA